VVFLKAAPTDRVDRANVLAPPLRPKADEDAAKMVRSARAVIFMVVSVCLFIQKKSYGRQIEQKLNAIQIRFDQ